MLILILNHFFPVLIALFSTEIAADISNKKKTTAKKDKSLAFTDMASYHAVYIRRQDFFL